MTGIKQKYQDLFFQTEQTVNRKKSGFRAAPKSVHEGLKTFKCDICKTSFVAKDSLEKHIASIHEGKKPFQCEICNTGFSQKGHVRTHIATVHEKQKPF